MKKKVIVLLLCIGSCSVGMDRPLSGSKPEPESKFFRYRRKQLLPSERQYIATLLGLVQDNKALNLKYQLHDKSDKISTNWLGHTLFMPGALPDLLCYKASASLLYEAVNLCHERCATFLLEYNAHPTLAIKGGDTPLHVAKSSSAVQLLMDHGALINQKNDKGETSFFKCIKNFCLDVAQALYCAGADVNASDKDDDTPLHYAVNCLDEYVIKFLLYRGAHIDCRNKQGETPYQIIQKKGGAVLRVFKEWQTFFHAINFTIQENRFLTIMSLLADDGKQLRNILMQNSSDYCSSDITVAEKLFNRCGDEVWDALQSHASQYSIESLRLARCVRNRFRDRNDFLQALCCNNFSLAYQCLTINPYLLHTHEGEYDKYEVNAIFADKIFSCISDDQYPYVQKMMDSGFFDVNYCNELGMPLLSVVIQNGYNSNKYLDLLKAGACANAKDKYGNTPLLYAVMLEDKDMISKLLLYGAVVNKDFGESFSLPDAMLKLMNNAYDKQKCVTCETHDYDLSYIPCVNRHLGHFICTQCYDKNSQKRCPLCRRSMGAFGL